MNGGWLVGYFCKNSKDASSSLVFIKDVKHEWVYDKEKWEPIGEQNGHRVKQMQIMDGLLIKSEYKSTAESTRSICSKSLIFLEGISNELI